MHVLATAYATPTDGIKAHLAMSHVPAMVPARRSPHETRNYASPFPPLACSPHLGSELLVSSPLGQRPSLVLQRQPLLKSRLPWHVCSHLNLPHSLLPPGNELGILPLPVLASWIASGNDGTRRCLSPAWLGPCETHGSLDSEGGYVSFRPVGMRFYWCSFHSRPLRSRPERRRIRNGHRASGGCGRRTAWRRGWRHHTGEGSAQYERVSLPASEGGSRCSRFESHLGIAHAIATRRVLAGHRVERRACLFGDVRAEEFMLAKMAERWAARINLREHRRQELYGPR